MKRYTIEEMKKMSGIEFATSVLQTELNERTNPYSPVAQKLGESICELELNNEARLFYRDLKEIFCTWEAARAKNPMLCPLTGCIVFKNSSFDVPRASFAARTYRVSSDAFSAYNMDHGSIMASLCSNGERVDLKPLMIEENGRADGWRVDYCLLTGREN